MIRNVLKKIISYTVSNEGKSANKVSGRLVILLFDKYLSNLIDSLLSIHTLNQEILILERALEEELSACFGSDVLKINFSLKSKQYLT